ncbi:MAG TPA: hypothetical protein GXZ86_08265 [Clostridiales bacterium]|nr:hypothetical protein [Clostridiales bacterium]
MTDKTILDSIRDIIARADEAKANDDGSDYSKGRLMGLAEALSILQIDFVGVEEIEKLIDFDIDKKYLL